MSFPSLASATAQPIFWALTTPDHTQVAFRVIGGLAVIAALEILAGLWMIHAGHSHRQPSSAEPEMPQK